MFTARRLAQSAPRVMRQFARTSIRSVNARYGSAVEARPLRWQSNAAFSTTAGRRAVDESVSLDAELRGKLATEIQIEEDIKSQEQLPSSIADFLENTPFELIDTPGHEVVKLVRSFGDEKITVSFSVADVANYDPYTEDAAVEDEDFDDAQPPTSNKQGSRGAAADQEVEEIEEDLDDESGVTAAPINLSIVVEKPGKTAGALNIEATAQDGNIVVENMFFYDDAKLAKVDSPESAQKRADVYPGPPFGTLDEDLQVLMERFLEERGITQTLAVFVPDYVDVKEQREYLRWLGNVQAFIEA